MDSTKNGTTLPNGVKASDLKMPSYKSWSKRGDAEKLAYDVGDRGTLTFYEVKGYGWVIVTLRIGNGRFGTADRYYGIRASDGAAVRVGKGPHVLRTVRVFVRESRRKALAHLTDLYAKGLESAHVTRDRISSRRFQGQVERAAGRHSWRWDS